jgi:cytidyltransferase-like protein
MHSHIFVAGTFDGLHAGHRFLLARAFQEAKKVTIGLTSDLFVQKFKIFNLQFSMKISNFKLKIRGYEERKKCLQQWLQMRPCEERFTIIPIDDPYEPASSIAQLDALVVTAQNKVRGGQINELRRGRGLPPLTLIEVPLVAAEDGKPISSTRLRNGEIDQDGTLVMPESMRADLGKPIGKVIKRWIPGQARSDNRMIITVGDIVTKTLLDAGKTPFLAIIDGKVGRQPFDETLKRIQLQKVKPLRFKSGPGYISREAMKAIRDCFLHSSFSILHSVILIDGEEDLLVLPAIVYAPIGARIYYGQPGEGLVEVAVTEAKKQSALALLSKFLS